MKNVKITVFLLFSVLFAVLAPTFSAIASTSLSHYEAIFEAVANNQGEYKDIQAELKITYQIDNKLKTGGMKFVEAQSIEAVQVTDGEGKPLRFQISHSGKRYSKISWHFPGISKGEQVVIVHFKLPDALSVVGGKNYFRAFWVGSWVVPVDKALYRFIFPAGYSYKECSIYPQYEYKEKIVEGKKQIEVPIAPLRGESFTLAFSPSFREWEGAGKADSKGNSIDKTLSSSEETEKNVIEQVRFGVHDAFSRIVFDLKRETAYRVAATPQENVITVSLPNCTLSSQAKGKVYNDTLVKGLELKEKSGKEVVAKIELTKIKSAFTHIAVNDPPRIIFNIRLKKDEAKSKGGTLEKENKGSEQPDITEKRVSQLVPPPPEEKIKEEKVVGEEIKVEVIKEEKIKQEVIKEEEIKREDEVLLASSLAMTSTVPHRRAGEKQAVSAEEKRIYDSARELFQQERYKEALSNLRYFMDKYPRSGLADAVSFLIGDSYFYLAKEGTLTSYQPAVDAYQLALALYPESEEVPRGLFQLADSFREMAYYYEAEENYQLLMDEYPNAEYILDAHFWMAENFFKDGEFEEARDQFQRFITKYPQGDQLKMKRAVFRVADCYVGLKDYGRAQKGYEKALNRWPTHAGLFPETLFNMGLSYLKNGHYSKARSVLLVALNIFPEQDYNHIVLAKIGDTYKMEGRVEEALKVYSQNTVLYPESEGALISEIKMADIGVKNPGFFSFDQYLDPLRVYQRIIEKYPTTDLAEEALFKQGFAFSKQKKYQEAIATLMTVLEEYPDSDLSRKCFFSLQENLYKLVDSYFSEEKYYAILGLYRKYENPFLVETKNTRTLFQTGESFRQGGLYDKALELYGKARRIYPRSYPEDELILRMGEVYLLKKEYAKAERMFEKLIENFPESSYRKLAFHNLADTYYGQESYNEARHAYLTALEGQQRIPRDIRGFFYLGKCYQALGNVSLTIDAYRNAIRVAEHLGEDQGEQGFVIKSYFQLADCLYQNRKYLEAIKVYTQAVERYSEDDRVQWALYRIAESYRKVGKGKADIESLKKVVSKGEREAFWEKVISENIRNLEWEVKNREHLVP